MSKGKRKERQKKEEEGEKTEIERREGGKRRERREGETIKRERGSAKRKEREKRNGLIFFSFSFQVNFGWKS